jgi:glycosyltransferase involved in cell wall biosynthesis
VARVALFFWDGWVGSSPTVINALRALAARGYRVDLVTRFPGPQFAPLPDLPTGVRVFQSQPLSRRLARWRAQAGPRLGSAATGAAESPGTRAMLELALRAAKSVVRATFPWVSELVDYAQFAVISLARTVRYRYTCCIGFDTNGLLAAALVAWLKRSPFFYWSLELTFLNDLREPLGRLAKRLEKVCGRHAAALIIQDADRAATLVRENGMRRPTVFIVPHGPMGPPVFSKSEYFQRKFCLPPDTKVLLNIGLIDPSTLSLELARVADRFARDCVLVFHSNLRYTPEDPYLAQVAAAGQERALFSLEPVPYDDLTRVVGSGYVGIVLYRRELGPNHSLVAGASGKLGQYLRCGLPVVGLNLPGLGDAVRMYGSGLCVEDIRDLPRAVEMIRADYASYSANAVRHYEDAYEFGTHFENVVNAIKSFGS